MGVWKISGYGMGEKGMVELHYEYTGCHWNVHWKMVKIVNFVSCIFYHNEKWKYFKVEEK